MWNTSVSCTKETKKLQLGWVELLVFILKAGTCSLSSALNFLIGVTTPCSFWRASSWDGFLQQQPSPARFQSVGTAEVDPAFLGMIWWQKDEVVRVKGNIHNLHGEEFLSRRSPWALLPLYLYYMWLHPACAVLNGRGVNEGLNVNWWVRVTSCVARSTLESQSGLGKWKAVCLMVSTYIWRVQYVGGGVIEEQCMCLCVKLCIKKASLIKTYILL